MKTKVFVAIPTTGNVIDSQSFVLRDIAEHYKDQIELVYPEQCVRRMFHDFARNEMVEEFLRSDCDILWFLDSDVTPNKHVMDLVAIHQDKWQVAGATYPVFMKPGNKENILEVVFTCYKRNKESGNFTLEAVPKEGSAFVDGLATGCLFIKREVFGLMHKPYFEFKFKEANRDLAEGEDLGFVRKLNALGIKTYTDFSFVCRHQKNIDLLDVNNYAISYSNRNLEAYDKTLREQVQEAVKSAYQAGYNKGLNQKPKNSLILPTNWSK